MGRNNHFPLVARSIKEQCEVF